MSSHDLHHHPVTWRAHLWWAALILVPFLASHLVKALGSGDTATTLLLYGPVIASIWIAGHLTLAWISRDSAQRSTRRTVAATRR
jgi:hypothetical protein